MNTSRSPSRDASINMRVKIIVNLTVTVAVSISIWLGVDALRAGGSRVSGPANPTATESKPGVGFYRGKVLRADGRPWPGLTVEPNSFGMHNVDTESDGRFTLEGRDGQEVKLSILYDPMSLPFTKRVQLTAAAEQVESIHLPLSSSQRTTRKTEQSSGVSVLPPAQIDDVPAVPIKPLQVKGRVIEAPNGGPVANAVVSIAGVLRPGAITNPNGYFALDTDEDTSFAITVKKAGYLTERADVEDVRKEQLIRLRR